MAKLVPIKRTEARLSGKLNRLRLAAKAACLNGIFSLSLWLASAARRPLNPPKCITSRQEEALKGEKKHCIIMMPPERVLRRAETASCREETAAGSLSCCLFMLDSIQFNSTRPYLIMRLGCCCSWLPVGLIWASFFGPEFNLKAQKSARRSATITSTR